MENAFFPKLGKPLKKYFSWLNLLSTIRWVIKFSLTLAFQKPTDFTSK